MLSRDKCPVCGEPSNFWTFYKGQSICDDCHDRLKKDEIIAAGEKITKAEDFKGWDHGDMSDLFWHHLGEYVKDRNPEIHFPKMKSALYWAFHDSHGLSSSFVHALEWAKVPLEEVLRWSC